MPNYNVTNNIDTLLRSTSNAAARTSLELGDAATKNTGTTAGTVAAGNDSRITGALQTSGGTMTGKLTAAADATNAKLNIGGRVASGSPTTLVDGDLWISNQGALSYRDSSTPFNKAVASLNLKQIFNQPQTISGTFNSDIALTVSNTGTREAVVISNTAAATSDAVVITNLGSGNSLVVNDETTPDSTRFAIANNGKVGIGVTPDASVALSVDTTGIKFGDNTTQTTAGLTGTVQEANGGTGETTYTNGQLLIGNAAGGLTKATLSPGTNVTITNGDGAITINATGGGSGTVTSVTAGTGLTGGTITSTGTIAADFGATTGKVTEGGTTVLKTGDTMTGKLTLPAVTAASAPLNLGSANTDPTTSANGDVWIRNNLIKYKGSSATVNTVAATAEPNNFTTNQAVTPTGTTTPVALAITQNAGNPNGALTVDLPNTSSTAAAVRITNLGAGPSLLVEDSNPDTTPFTVSASGRVGIGAAPDASVALSVDTSGIKFGDNTTQTTAFTGTASNVTGTVAIANGGTGATTQPGAANAVLPSQASNSGKFLTTDGSNVSWATAGGGGGSTTQVARYLTTQNVSVPAGAKKLDVFCVGGGGGGGGASGSNGALANRGGGAGGGAGGFSTASFDATALPASIQVVVGAAGTAGTGGTGLNDGTAGGSAGRSGVTTIGADITTFPCFISAFQGNGGGAGLTNGSGGSAGSAATSALFSGTNGGAGGSGGGAGSAGSAQNASAGARGPTGGGGGGAISTTTFANGAAGGNLVLQASGGGGTAGTTNGANGGNGWTALYDGQTAAGGGGGAGSSTGTGGTGGAGGFPGGGGGGGGAGINNGGNGGAGGAGIVVLTWYF